MNKMKSVKTNALLSGLRSILNVIFPLITFPYITRVLNPNNLGRITFSQSIISYFTLLAALGLSNYAIREGAKIRNEKAKVEKFACEVYSVNVITTICSLVLLFIITSLVPVLYSYAVIIYILSLSIVFTTYGAEWLNSIYEDYLYITVRSFSVQLISLVLLFLFVKSPDDVYVYAFLLSLSPALIGILNRIHCRQYFRIRFTLHCNFKKHIVPMLIFFANTVSVTIYCNADMTMLGLFKGDYNVGIYSLSVKIYNIIKGLLAALILVTIPRLSNYYGEDQRTKFKELITSVTYALLLLLGPMIMGIIILADPVVNILGGSEYAASVCSLRILSVALLFAILGGIITNSINIPIEKEKNNLIATAAAAIVNIVLNLLFIPLFKENGAAFTTLLAELTVIVVCLYLDKDITRYMNLKIVKSSLLHSFVGMVITLIVWFMIKAVVVNDILIVILTTALTVMIYAAALVVLKDRYIMRIYKEIKSRFGKKVCS